MISEKHSGASKNEEKSTDIEIFYFEIQIFITDYYFTIFVYSYGQVTEC